MIKHILYFLFKLYCQHIGNILIYKLNKNMQSYFYLYYINIIIFNYLFI